MMTNKRSPALCISILLWSIMLMLAPIRYIQAQSILTPLLLSRIGTIQNEQGFMQFTNLQHCNRTVSVTAGHYVTYKMVDKIKPDAKLLYLDENLDVAIFESLGPVFPATISRKLPELLDEVYLATYVKYIQIPVILKLSVAGFSQYWIAYQGMLFFGASGSGLYDKTGAYLGPIVAMATAPGFSTDLEGKPIPMQIGVASGVRTDRLVKILDELLCK